MSTSHQGRSKSKPSNCSLVSHATLSFGTSPVNRHVITRTWTQEPCQIVVPRAEKLQKRRELQSESPVFGYHPYRLVDIPCLHSSPAPSSLVHLCLLWPSPLHGQPKSPSASGACWPIPSAVRKYRLGQEEPRGQGSGQLDTWGRQDNQAAKDTPCEPGSYSCLCIGHLLPTIRSEHRF